MKCPKCGADNPDGAEFCTLCMEKLASLYGDAAGHIPDGATGDIYMAPGEWKGSSEALRPQTSQVVMKKVRRFQARIAIYAVIVGLIAIWLILSFTVWGNPSPSQRAAQLVDAVNAGDEQAFLDLFREEDRPAAEDIYSRTAAFLGGSGSYDVEMEVDIQDNYSAVSYVENGTIQAAGGTIEVARSDNLMIFMENHKGRWYIIPRGTDIIP